MTTQPIEQLRWSPASAEPALVALPVASFLAGWPDGDKVAVAPIDPELADTAAFCERYGVPTAASANCVIVAGKRGGEVKYAACLVLATDRADVNGTVRRWLDVRKASFAAMTEAVELTGMEYGGITPLGLPAHWPILVAGEVAEAGQVVVGSGVRRSKLRLDGALLTNLPNAELVPDLSQR